MNKYIINTDGGARGNPGPAAIGYVIQGGVKKVSHGEYIGETTNNVAEYTAAIVGLTKLKSLLGAKEALASEVEVRMDSELVVKQMKREYKVKNAALKDLFIEVSNICQSFKSVSFKHVFREDNSGADELVNKALDKKLS